MKTTDGHEITGMCTYYLETGQEVMLESFAKTAEGKDVFVVIPLYEGEAMSVNGDGGQHNEITIAYEHEGLPTLVNSLFCEPPLEKLHTKYKARLKDLEGLSLAISELLLSKQSISSSIAKLKSLEKEAGAKFTKANVLIVERSNVLEKLVDKIKEKRQALSDLEDSVCVLKNEDVSSLISKTELQRLNRRDSLLEGLEAGGVDNWEWYDESLKDYRERYPQE